MICTKCNAEMERLSITEWACLNCNWRIFKAICPEKLINAASLRDLIRQYGSELSDKDYEVLYQFGLWFADLVDADEVVLSDWTAFPQRIIAN